MKESKNLHRLDLQLQYNDALNNRLHRVKQALDTNIHVYETVHLKVKITAYTPW